MTARPPPEPGYDWAMTMASLWLSGGIMIDAWYHFHSTVETFFEPAHALLYAGLLAAYVFTAFALRSGRRQGYPWRRSLPAGYEATVAGLIVCVIGGLSDMVKHSLWGFEEGFNALLSPTHLLIGAGMLLIVTGPIRSVLSRKPTQATWLAQLPLLLSAASMMELIHWGTQFVFLSEAEAFNAPLSPASVPHSTLTLLTLQYDKQGIGLLAVVVQSVLVAGFFLYLARRIRLALGAVTVLLVVGNVFIAAADSNYPGQFVAVIGASLVAGILADALRLDPAKQFSKRWRIASFAVPAAYWATLLTVLDVTMGGVWWSSDVLAGSILFAGLVGLLLGTFSAPPLSER